MTTGVTIISLGGRERVKGLVHEMHMWVWDVGRIRMCQGEGEALGVGRGAVIIMQSALHDY